MAYALWLHGKSAADRQDRPTGEIMIWLNRQGGAGPPGTKYGSVSLGGVMWDICQGDIGWKVYSFVSRKLLSDDKYVSGIESGSEVFQGSGRLDITAYSVDIG
ncbi:hypothetical protein ABZX77_32570 [Streptomyces sp. NPDC004237]|uniref:GH12 family glycosyl hydrolase domain-containing protein n=1 Tax=Streptomyces sp. NPDC004237 TaxID=3154455 RepID=UPI0033B3F302